MNKEEELQQVYLKTLNEKEKKGYEIANHIWVCHLIWKKVLVIWNGRRKIKSSNLTA